MAGLGEAEAVRAVPLWRRIEPRTLMFTLLFAVVALFVIYPLVQVVMQSFMVTRPGVLPVVWGFSGWEAIAENVGLQKAAWNTVKLTLARQFISLIGAVFIAWVLARTDVPGARYFEFAFWLAFFLPSLSITLSWILALEPQFGLFNQLLRGFEPGTGPFNIYSFWGIVWVHVMGTNLAIKVMILTPTFRNMNSALEDASRITGASNLRTTFKIFLPLMIPAILAVELLALLRSLEAFEIEQILGVPIGLFVFSTWIYDTINLPEPRFDAVGAIAVLIVVVATCLILIQRLIVRKNSHATLSGNFQSRLIRLGAWRWPVFGFLLLMVLVIIGVPLVFSLMGTFMKLFGFFTIADPWTTKHWMTAFNDRAIVQALKNTAVLAISTALIAVFLHSLIAYIIVRGKFFAKNAFDLLTWLPFTVPGILLSLGLLTLFLQPALRPIYGTMATLVIALVIAGMPFAVQLMKASLIQIGNELEEASWVAGGSWWRTYTRVVLPLISPSLVVIGLISFIAAARDISQVALLSNSKIRPLSMLQLEYMIESKYEVAAILATILMFFSVTLAVIARVFGYRGVRSS